MTTYLSMQYIPFNGQPFETRNTYILALRAATCLFFSCHGISLSCFGVMRMVNSHTYLNINQRLVKLDYTNRHLSNSITFPVNLSPVQVDRIDRPFSRTFAQRLDLTMICLPKHCTKVNQTFNFTYLNINQRLVNWIILIVICQIPSHSR